MFHIYPIPLVRFEGVLGGAGAAIQLGRHARNTPYAGRIVGCGATGYHQGHSMNAVVWWVSTGGLVGSQSGCLPWLI